MCMYRRFAVFLLATILLMQPAFAWSEGGHHLIARLAFSRLGAGEQQQVLGILKQHPRFAEDFVAPANLQSDDELNPWIMGRAGYWPDIARKQPLYHRSTWHYQLGSSLSIGDRVMVPETPGPLSAGATAATEELYIAQAIELNRRILRNPSSTPPEKAIAISWLAHLVADAHQPCHAGSLYVDGIFPEGDRGANSIPTKQGRNLHSLWDGLFGSSDTPNNIKRRALEVEQVFATVRLDQRVVGNLDPQVWLAESVETARSHVYTTDVLAAVEAAQRSGATKVEIIDLPQPYLKDAGSIAQLRAGFAARRLAAILQEDLRP